MLRFATIAALCLLNLSVWVGPAERFMSYTMTMFDHAPRLERADYYVLAGDHRAALEEFQAFVAANPSDSSGHLALASFCYINAGTLRAELGMASEAVTALIQREYYQARSLDEEDYALSYQYAFAMLDEELMRTGVTCEQAVEAWTHVLHLVEGGRTDGARRNSHGANVAQVHIQLARIMSRFGNPDAAQAHLDMAFAAEPGIKIPAQFIELNAAVLTP